MKKLTTSLLTLSLGLTLASNAFADKIYWSEIFDSRVRRADSDGSNVENTLTGTNFILGLALDNTNSKMYYTSVLTDKIVRTDLDGSNSEDLVTGLDNPQGIALDVTNSKMYWCENGSRKIFRADLDGSNVEQLYQLFGNPSPKEIALDVTNSKMYWTESENGVNDKIRRADFDGSNQEDLVTTGLGLPEQIALDLINSKMYWCDTGTNKIQRANLDGSSIEDVITGTLAPKGVALDLVNSKMYWVGQDESKIKRTDLDGSNSEDVLTGLSNPQGIALDFGDVALSVELNSFAARQIENTIQINWATASETENEGFNIYRKNGENSFVQIASYKGFRELQGQGNSSFETNYTFVDNSNLKNNEFYTYVISDVETNGIETKHSERAQTVKFILDEEINSTKLDYVLAQNFPNPFNPSTTISYDLAKDTKVSLKIYNEKGDFVKELANGFQHEGSHNAVWNGTDSNGKSVSSGTYFYKITAGTFTQTNKMILLK